ncbi:MAG: DEAD/DEAH box helicase [Gemmatimonadetes bacterium]|nr:DEAD/DEAH box helicase [Gemmatimonadota bacterium]
MAIRPASGDLPVSRAGVSGAPRQFAWRTAPARPARRPPCHQGLHVTFASLALHPSLLRGLKELGFTRPTPIQNDAIPHAIEGRDLLACAATGSGKTAAFLLPILHRLIERPRGTTRALVLTPTRELAAQILEDLNDLSVHTPITAAAIYGGVGMGPQEHALRSGVDVIVATPGRLLDHLKQSYASLANIEHLVLDEADRMLDMGFLPDIRRILKQLPTKRQTLFFSATMPGPIGQLAHEMLRNPATINLERKAAPAVGITQAVYPVSQDLKSSLLLQLLVRGEMQEVLVFTRTKHRADRLQKFLAKHDIAAERIHGNRSQPQRTEALAGFKSGKYRVLVATDIAARGIDVEELGHVVNFDVPMAPEDYIHRVGRTGRAQATGDAFTFVSPEEEADLADIERKLSRRLQRVILPDFDYTARVAERLEVSQAERTAKWREQKAKERENAKAKAERKLRAEAEERARRDGRSQRDADPRRRQEERGGAGRSSGAPRGASTSSGRGAGSASGAAGGGSSGGSARPSGRPSGRPAGPRRGPAKGPGSGPRQGGGERGGGGRPR